MEKDYNTIYNSRKWLNPDYSPFTGSLVCHLSTYTDEKEPEKTHINAFVELGGCHSKSRIHHDWDSQDIREYRDKVKIIRDEIDKYLENLEKFIGGS